MQDTAVIYLILDESESPRYVGKTFRPHRRPLDHFRKHPAWAKTFRVLEIVRPGVRWQDRERYWIAYYRRFASLENVARGGGSAGFKSPETIERFRDKMRGRKMSEEQKALLRNVWANRPPCMGGKLNKGRKHTNEHRQRLRESLARSGAGKGERHNMAKITSAIAREIRAKFVPRKYSSRRLASEYGLAKTTILDIVRGKIWANA